TGTFNDLTLERLVYDVPDSEVDEALKGMEEQSRPFNPKDGAAASGDKVTIDFAGKVDGVAFDGGTGTDMDVVIGSNSFIPGFEEQLTGIKAGEARVLNVKFPDEYQAAHLAGKDATFDVTAKKIEAPGELTVDDDFAKKFGLDDLGKLKDAVRADIARQYQMASREKLKRRLLDALDKKYSFDLPPSLVEQEFDNIWKQVETERQQSGKSFEDEGTTQEAARADYRKIAERRVRLGLVMAKIGEDEKVEVTDEELTQAIIARARQFPGQEKAIWDFFRNNPQQAAQLRAPIFEEKVVDLITGKASVTDKAVSKEELLKPEEDDKP
ncbi:MAG: trigger factor, partial [Alphaproteobacteria bacterium]|nr:trigger factor [Alphaproteobacteria bacterium]